MLVIKQILEKTISEMIRFNMNFHTDNELNIVVLVPSLQFIKNDILNIAKIRIERSLKVKVDNLRAEFLNKKEPNVDWIAYEIKSSILRRENPVRVINHFLKLAAQFSLVKGILIELKGRFKAKNKTQKSIFKEGNLRIQSLESKIEYAESLIIGKYGTSSVKVVMGYN